MSRWKRIISAKAIADERGQALILVLVLLLIGSLTIPPTLSYMGSSLMTGQIYGSKTDELYAADAGIDDAIWQIKYEQMETIFTSPAYDTYDYATTWTYSLPESINDMDTVVDVKNVWVVKDTAPLAPAQGRAVIEAGKLIVAGNAPTASSYRIKIAFYPEAGEQDTLMVETLGVWLPLGFSYVAGSSNLEADPFADYYSVPEVSPHCGGQAVVWSFGPSPFASFPGADPLESPMMAQVTFEFSATQAGSAPSTISWITTSGVEDVPFSWDNDTMVYQLTSSVGDTEIEAYSIKCGLRKLGSATAGDYRAIGNSLMIEGTGHPYNPYDIRYQLLASSDATVSDIPADAEVLAAYLYWSGWFGEGTPQAIWQDDCSDYSDWNNPASVWGLSSGRFVGHYLGSAPDSQRYLTMKNSLNLSSYAAGTVKVFWEQSEDGTLESSDALRFQFSGNGGSSWGGMITAFANDIGSSPQAFSYTIPAEYLTSGFKMRFYLNDFADAGEYCYVDNFAVAEMVYTADTSAVFKINGEQVCFDGGGLPEKDNQEIIASEWSIVGNEPGEYSYACFADVTMLVREFSNPGSDENHTGNGIYTAGGVDADTGNQWSYAGWSLVIVYCSAETQGHQFYLYDNFIYSGMGQNIDFDGDGAPGGIIAGFIIPEPGTEEENAASLTCFVGEGDNCWSGDSLKFNDAYLSNSRSPWNNVWNSRAPGMSQDGVDIDTFHVSWASGLLEPGDTSAQLDLPTQDDSWNLIYIILSVRSETVAGSTLHYAISGG